MDASREGCDAPDARDSSSDVFERNTWPRDRPAFGDRGIDGAGDAQALRIGGVDVAAGRRGSGSEAPRRRHYVVDIIGWGARIRTWEWRNQNPIVRLAGTRRELRESDNRNRTYDRW